VVGASVAAGFPLGVFGGMLEGLQKFYILNWTNIAASLLRVVLIVFYLSRGYGLLTVALITVGLPLIASVVRAIVALRALPVKFSSKYVNRDSLHHMANYSGATFMIIVASRLRFKTDAIVIGKFVSAAAISYFYAGSRLIDYTGELISSFAQILVPMSSQSDAAGKSDQLRKIFILGNRVCAFIALPIAAIFVILGKSIIEVWVGKKYVALGYPVLMTLIFPYTVMQIQGASSRVLLGISKHKRLATVALIEGLSNLALSILLVRPYGIVGDALGTAIPMAGTYFLFLPQHVCSRLGVRVSSYLRHAYALPLLLCAPLAAVLLLMRRWFVAHTYRQLALQLLAGLAVYGAGIAWAYLTGRALDVGELLASDRPSSIDLVPAPAVETLPEDV
jgi:O-antigen/teichoic acid export membrane protein